MGFFSDVSDFLFGEDQSRAIAETQRKEGIVRAGTDRARGDILSLIPQGQAAQSARQGQAFNLLSGQIPNQISAILGNPLTDLPSGTFQTPAFGGTGAGPIGAPNSLQQAFQRLLSGFDDGSQPAILPPGVRAPGQAILDPGSVGGGAPDGGFGGVSGFGGFGGFDVSGALSGLTPFSGENQLSLPESFGTLNTANTLAGIVPGIPGIAAQLGTGATMLSQVNAELARLGVPELTFAQMALAATSPFHSVRGQGNINLSEANAPFAAAFAEQAQTLATTPTEASIAAENEAIAAAEAEAIGFAFSADPQDPMGGGPGGGDGGGGEGAASGAGGEGAAGGDPSGPAGGQL